MTEVEILKKEMQDVLQDNILHFWLANMQDEEHGNEPDRWTKARYRSC